MSKIIVIGGNAAGMSFAAKYKRNNPSDEIIVFEKNDRVSFGACGLPYFAHGNFDDKEVLYSRTVNQIIESGIDLRINEMAIDIDFTNKIVETDQGNKQEYDKLIISTGASPIVPPTIKLSDNIQTLTSMSDAELLRKKLEDENIKHLTIIGAGFIGLEVADVAKQLGKKVTIVEASENILEKHLENELITIVEDNLRNKGIELLTANTVTEIEDNLVVKTNKQDIQTDHVVVSIGFKPNTNNFTNLEKLSNGAIVTNENFETSIKDVYAIGDCATVKNMVTNKTEYIALATVANKQGRALADKLCNIDNSYNGMLGSSALKVLDLDVARTGLTTKQCIESGIDFSYKIITEKTHTSYYPGQEDIHICLVYEKETLKIVGAQIIGKKDVVHRLNTLALAISKGVTTKELGYIDFAYAPPFSRTWEALNVAGNVAKK